MDTINRLLKKQAPKRRRRAELSEALREEGEEDEDGNVVKANPVFSRYMQRADGRTTLSLPEEWLANGRGLGTSLAKPVKKSTALKPVNPTPFGRRMVEEVA
jgi:Ino eighty subunit 2